MGSSVSPWIAERIGVTRAAPSELVAHQILVLGGRRGTDLDVPIPVGDWFTDHLVVAMFEGESDAGGVGTSEVVVGQALKGLRTDFCPSVLRLVAPTVVVPAGPAKDIGKVCRRLLREHLPPFIDRVLLALDQPLAV